MGKKTKKPETPKSPISLKSLDDIRRFLAILDGTNPDTQQSLNNFVELDNIIQRTNLPNRKDVQRVAYLDYAGKIFYPEDPHNPFTEAANTISLSFMAKGGWIAGLFVDLFRNTPNLADFQTQQPPQQQQSTLDKFLRRGKTE